MNHLFTHKMKKAQFVLASGAAVVFSWGIGAALALAAPTDVNNAIHIDNPLKGSTDVTGFIGNVLHGLVLLLTPVLVIMLIYSGFLFVQARGNTEKLGEAKKALMYTLIGAALVLGAETAAKIIGNTVNGLVS